MTESSAAVPAQVSDFPELMEVLAISYDNKSAGRDSFDRLAPDMYRPVAADMANIFVMRDTGRIVNAVGLFPMALCACGQVVEIGGIGGVCTLPEYRGKDLMQQNLDVVMAEMVRRGYPFAWLSGDRRRYRPWGFEICRTGYTLTLGTRGPGFDKHAGKLTGKIQEGPIGEMDWRTIWQQTANVPELRPCGEERLRLKYGRLGLKVRMVDGPAGGHILVRHSPDHRGIVSYAGEPATVAAIVADSLTTDGTPMKATVPATPGIFHEPFEDLMTNYELAYSGDAAVLDLAKTLSLFAPYFDGRVADMGLKGTVRMVMRASRSIGRQEVLLNADGKRLTVQPTDRQATNAPVLEMTCHKMVDLLFSPRGADHIRRADCPARWLAALMPLPIFIPPLYQV